MAVRPGLLWSDDGATVTKSHAPRRFRLLDEPFDSFVNELRVNRMFLRAPPPVPTPRLIASSWRARSITLEAIGGAPLGPKYPEELTSEDVDDLADLVDAMGCYAPRRRWLRRLPLVSRLRHHVAAGVVGQADAGRIANVFRAQPPVWAFCHADVTARNVLRGDDGALVLIDWEWAGLYPAEYELAFLWFSLVDLPWAREHLERRVPPDRRLSFVACALLVQLLHLDMWAARANSELPRPRHLVTRDQLLEELRALDE